MKKFKITNKKTFATFVFFVLLLVGALAFLIFKIVQFKRGSHNVQGGDSGVLTEVENSQEGQKQIAPAQTYTAYDNQQYSYEITFPDNWYLSSDLAEEKPEDTDIEGKKIKVGGQTFWSNYKNIDEFSPEQKPEDFHLLGLTIYEAGEMSADDLASTLGFDEASVLQKNVFEGKGISGTEFVAGGVDEKNPLVMIIFQKDQRFYVFNIGFPNGDAQAAETMENIAKTLTLK